MTRLVLLVVLITVPALTNAQVDDVYCHYSLQGGTHYDPVQGNTVYELDRAPWNEGKDISFAVLKVLKRHGYTAQNSNIYLQTFDFNELKGIKKELFPPLGVEIKLVQLIAETDSNITGYYKDSILHNYSYDWMFEGGAMAEIAKYADGIGPKMSMIASSKSTQSHLILSDMAREAHENGMVVHPYTFRKDAGKIPLYASSFEQLLAIFYDQADVDGVFTDCPDPAVRFLQVEKQRSVLM